MSTAPNQDNRTQPENAVQKKQALWMLIVAVVITLFTYQVFHHGLWGKLQSLGKAPKLVLTGTTITPSMLDLAVYNTNGPGTYGEFTTQVKVSVAGQTTPVEVWNEKQLAAVPKSQIHNYYPFQKIAPGPNGLIVPLAAKGTIDLPLDAHAAGVLAHSPSATVSVEDVSGLIWTTTQPVK
jgi:thiosulfate dehydrogenase [quinone] small subunit